MNPGPTPYKSALESNPPLPCGTRVQFVDSLPGGFGEVIGHSALFDNNVFVGWKYVIVPTAMRYGSNNGGILMSIEKTDKQILKVVS